MKLNNVGRREEVLRTGASLRWATVLVIATLGTGLEPARAGINEWTSVWPYSGPIKALAIDPQKAIGARYDFQHDPVPRRRGPGPSGLRLLGNPVVAASGQPDRRDPAHVRERWMELLRPAVGRAAERAGAGDHGTAHRRPPVRATPDSGEAVEESNVY